MKQELEMRCVAIEPTEDGKVRVMMQGGGTTCEWIEHASPFQVGDTVDVVVTQQRKEDPAPKSSSGPKSGPKPEPKPEPEVKPESHPEFSFGPRPVSGPAVNPVSKPK